ncbi:hypothetical protein GGI11_002090 [Coemansia sp. RSA 2049]|nr:hypothetical protein GGI11_002090 [Coemansia sp. RSA 2049]
MDLFKETVDSQTVWLDGTDAGVYLLSVSVCYWFENSANESPENFMPANVMKRAFYKTMEEFPILAGQLKATSSSSHLYVEIDKDNLNMPSYTDRYCSLDYAAMRKSGFNILKLPIDGLSREYGPPVSSGLIRGKVEPAHFRIVRFKNNSGVLVFASIAHYITDGYGYSQFMNRWAEIARWMQQQAKEDAGEPLPVRKYNHDRSFHRSYRSSKIIDLEPAVVRNLTADTAFSRAFAWLSPGMRARVLRAVSYATPRSSSFFHVSSAKMEELRTKVQAHAPEGTRYTINDVITAYLAIVVGQAKEKAVTDWWSRPVPRIIRRMSGNRLGNPMDLVAAANINIRPRIDDPSAGEYVGNMVVGGSTVFSRDEIQQSPTKEALAAMALKVHRAILAVDKQYIGQVGHLVSRHPGVNAWAMLQYARKKNKLGISNQFRFPHYGVDFGSGIPSMVRQAPHPFANSVFIMPDNPQTGGYLFEFNLAPDVEANLIANNDWMQLVDGYSKYQ